MSAYDSAIEATPGVVGYWPLDETSGTVATDHVGGNDGTYHGGITLGAAGPDGANAVTFDGLSGYVGVPDAAALDLPASFSIEFWAKTAPVSSPPFTTYAPFVTKYDFAADRGYGFAVRPIASAGFGSIVADGPSSDDENDWPVAGWFGDGIWHRILAVHNENTGLDKLYVDNVLISSQPTQAPATGAKTNTKQLSFGAWPSTVESLVGAQKFLAGSMCRVALYDLVITPAVTAGVQVQLPGDLKRVRKAELVVTQKSDSSAMRILINGTDTGETVSSSGRVDVSNFIARNNNTEPRMLAQLTGGTGTVTYVLELTVLIPKS